MSVTTFGFTVPAKTMPEISPVEPTISAILRNALIWLKQRMDVLQHLQQSGNGPFVIQMQSPAAGTANAFSQDRMGFRQDGSNFLTGPLDRVTINYSSTIALQASDYIAIVDATAAACTVYLPQANTVPGREFLVKKVDNVNTVTITATAGDKIDNSTTLPLTLQYEAAKLVSDGLGWWIV
jgi:hypothetical protein